MLMCPHCGWKYDPIQAARKYKNFLHDLVPTHDFPKFTRAVCPGSQQHPRNPEADRRPLWKDDPLVSVGGEA